MQLCSTLCASGFYRFKLHSHNNFMSQLINIVSQTHIKSMTNPEQKTSKTEKCSGWDALRWSY